MTAMNLRPKICTDCKVRKDGEAAADLVDSTRLLLQAYGNTAGVEIDRAHGGRVCPKQLHGWEHNFGCNRVCDGKGTPTDDTGDKNSPYWKCWSVWVYERVVNRKEVKGKVCPNKNG